MSMSVVVINCFGYDTFTKCHQNASGFMEISVYEIENQIKKIKYFLCFRTSSPIVF